MNRLARHIAVAATAVFTTLVLTPPAWALDRRAEASAKAALKKAAASYRTTDYASAMGLLAKAARVCGPTKCTPGTKAAVLRDLGATQFRTGDKAAASNSFAEALGLQADLALNPAYAAADLRAAWDAARGTGNAAESPSEGDFTHTPAVEQTTNTPLPVYVESAGSKFARVVVKYKGAATKAWQSLDLKRVGKGWGGVIPCGQVTAGTMRYWIEGFDQGTEASGTSGDPDRPFTVPVRDEISSEPPHLPNRPPPQQCDEDQKSAGRANEDEADHAHPSDVETLPNGEYARWWVGLAGAVDLLTLPGASDACALNTSGAPANGGEYYCTDPNGSDFPPRGSGAQTSPLVRGEAGDVGGGFQSGDVRLMLAADYALTPEILVGGRLGYVFNSYPGTAAVTDHRAFGAKVHVEARGTYLFGQEPLRHTGIAPMAFAAIGVSEFDGHVATVVSQQDGAAPAPSIHPVNAWRTNGPWFLAVGGGARYQFSPRAAFTGALRVNVAFGGLGALFTYGPEIAFQYGF